MNSWINRDRQPFRKRRTRDPFSLEDTLDCVFVKYPKCPNCGSKEVPTYKTDPGKPVKQYRKCSKCGHNFKTIEIENFNDI